LSAKLSWIGINAARVTQRAHVTAERLGVSTGEPDQSFTLVSRPVIPGSVQLMVGGQLWSETDDLFAAPAEVPVSDPRQTPGAEGKGTGNPFVYTVDRESGLIRFGDGLRGARPAAGLTLLASYDHGGGRQGMVGIGSISKGPSLPAGIKVGNPVPTWGGDEAESVEEAERRIPKYLQHRDRLVTATDFKDITLRTPGVDLGRVEVLPLFHPDLPDVPAAGVVTMLVIPRYDAVNPETPAPDRLFLDTVCMYLDPRRLITTEVHVCGPKYEPVWISVGITVLPGYEIAVVREAVKREMKRFLSPINGGVESTVSKPAGWPLNHPVDRLELWARAARVDGVSKVNNLLLSDSTGAMVDRVAITGLMLPRIAALSVQSGDPQPFVEPTAEVATQVMPVPVIPSECC
jgi:predicted phage baseplate assembly protein